MRFGIILWTLGTLLVACGKSGESDVSANDCKAAEKCRSILPNNDLSKEDRLDKADPATRNELNGIGLPFGRKASNSVSERRFREIIRIGLELYTPYAIENGEKLFINGNWRDSTVNANCRRSEGVVRINMYGGFARRPEITPEGFALVLCHELGHAYGGAPFILNSRNMSVEGQADFYGAGACLEKVLERLPGNSSVNEITTYMQDKCNEKHPNNPQGYEVCLRQFAGAQSLGKVIAKVMKEPIPDFETPDPTQVEKTLTSYPDTAQCRVDSFHNGIVGLPRPACWFKN